MELLFFNLPALCGLSLMFFSFFLQIKYLKFKRKIITTEAKIAKVINKKVFKIALVDFEDENKKEQTGQIYFFRKNFSIDEIVTINYNPKLIVKEDHSIVITPFLRKFHLSLAPMIFTKDQRPSVFHIGLIIIGFFMISLST